jgi:hypothetical protein
LPGGENVTTGRLFKSAIDAFREIYTEEPWASWAAAWSSGQDRTAVTAESVARGLDQVLGWKPPDEAWEEMVKRFPVTNLEDFDEDPDLIEEAVQIELNSLPRAADAKGTAALIRRMAACNLARSAVMFSHPDREPSTEETIMLSVRCALAIVRKVATMVAR